ESLWLKFAVTDTGVGISERELKSLFQPFVQADGTVSRKYGGTGLGLSITRGLVELMGGELGVERVKGQGSTFWFQVPFRRHFGLPQVRPGNDNVKGLRVLLLDDNPLVSDVILQYLDCWGMRGEVVDGTEAAVTKLNAAVEQRDPFRVAIVDLQLNGGSAIG